MALVIPPGFAQLSYPMRHASLAREAVITMGVDSSDWSGDYVDMCDRAAADLQGALGSFLDTQVTVGPVRASIGQDGGENLSVEGTYTFVGTASTERVSAQVALLMRKITGRGGRRGRGRLYIPWALADSVVDETGRIVSGSISSTQTALTAWRSAMLLGPQPTPPYLLHGTGNTPTGAPNEILSFQLDPVTGTQRRRLGR